MLIYDRYKLNLMKYVKKVLFKLKRKHFAYKILMYYRYLCDPIRGQPVLIAVLDMQYCEWR